MTLKTHQPASVVDYVRSQMVRPMIEGRHNVQHFGRYQGPDFEGKQAAFAPVEVGGGRQLDALVPMEIGSRGRLVGQPQGSQYPGGSAPMPGAFVQAQQMPPGGDWCPPSQGLPDPRPGCPLKPPPCDCSVMGATTLNTAGVAIATANGDGTNLVITPGDAPAFVVHWVWFEFLGVGANNFTVAAGNAAIAGLLTSVTVGTRPQGVRFTSQGSEGISANAYAATREPLCVDWAPFEPTNGRGLTVRMYNPSTVVTQGFWVFWGQIVAPGTYSPLGG